LELDMVIPFKKVMQNF